MNKNDKVFGLFENTYNIGKFSWPFRSNDASYFLKNARFCQNKEDFFKYHLNDYIFNETKNYVDNKCPYSLVNEGVIEYDNQIYDLFNSDLKAQEMNSGFLKKIESWDYINIISSALFYVLKEKIYTKHLSYELWNDICHLITHHTLGEDIFLLLKRNAFVEYDTDLVIFTIYHFLSQNEISFACRTEKKDLNEIGIIRLLSLLEINQVEMKQLIETSVKENSLNAIISFLEDYSFPNNEHISLDELKEFLSLLQTKNNQECIDEIGSKLENFEPFNVTASYDDVFLALTSGVPTSLFPTVLPDFFQQAFQGIKELYLAREKKIIEQFAANTLKNKAETEFKLTLKKDVLLKGTKLAEIIYELDALGFATFPKKQDIVDYLENLSQEEFEKICNDLLENHDLISKENLENLKKSKSKLIVFLVLALLFICQLFGPSFLISKSHAASLPKIAVSTKKNKPDSKRSNQIPKVHSTASTSYTTKSNPLNAQSNASTSGQSASTIKGLGSPLSKSQPFQNKRIISTRTNGIITTETIIFKIRKGQSECELQISRDDNQKTLTALGSFISYRDSTLVNKLIREHMESCRQDFPGYTIIPHEWDHPLVAKLQETLLFKTKEKKTDLSEVCAVDSRVNKIRAEEKYYFTLRENYDYNLGAEPLIIDTLSGPRKAIYEYMSNNHTLTPFIDIAETASLKQEANTLLQVKAYFQHSGLPKHLQCFFMENGVEQSHIHNEHAFIRSQNCFQAVEKCVESHLLKQLTMQSLWHLLPDKNCHAAVQMSLRMQEQNIVTAFTLDKFSQRAKQDPNFQATSSEMQKLEHWNNTIYATQTGLLSLDRINRLNIEKQCYSSQGRQGRDFTFFS